MVKMDGNETVPEPGDLHTFDNVHLINHADIIYISARGSWILKNFRFKLPAAYAFTVSVEKPQSVDHIRTSLVIFPNSIEWVYVHTGR